MDEEHRWRGITTVMKSHVPLLTTGIHFSEHIYRMAAVASPMQASSTHRASNVVVFEKTIDVDEDVCDFFDARFSSRDDLANIKNILKEQEAIGQDLIKKVFYIQKRERGMPQCRTRILSSSRYRRS